VVGIHHCPKSLLSSDTGTDTPRRLAIPSIAQRSGLSEAPASGQQGLQWARIRRWGLAKRSDGCASAGIVASCTWRMRRGSQNKGKESCAYDRKALQIWSRGCIFGRLGVNADQACVATNGSMRRGTHAPCSCMPAPVRMWAVLAVGQNLLPERDLRLSWRPRLPAAEAALHFARLPAQLLSASASVAVACRKKTRRPSSCVAVGG
jgi:hypothetical protein